MVGFFLSWGAAEAEVERPVITPETIIHTHLVALGKKRPKQLLPRLKRQRRPPPKDPTHLGQTVSKPREGEPPKRREPKESEPEKAPDRPSVDDILAQFSKDHADDERGDIDDPEGDPNGSVLGTSTSGRLQSQYADEIRARLEAYVGYSLLTEEELAKLQAQVYVEVSDTGKIASYRFVKNSGNPRFDESVTRAVGMFGVDGPREFPRFPEGVGFEGLFKAKITFKPGKK